MWFPFPLKRIGGLSVLTAGWIDRSQLRLSYCSQIYPLLKFAWQTMEIAYPKI